MLQEVKKFTGRELQVFDNPKFGKIRTMEFDGEPWFVGKDVTEILGYKDSINALKSHVDAEDKKGWQIATPSRGMQQATIINESGLYSLILSSKIPKAKEFKHWVTSEVLPSIRKHGMYATEELLENPDFAIAAFTALKEERDKRKKLETTVAVQEQQIAEMKPKASYYDLILNCKDLVSIGKIAKDYGKSAQWLNTLLHDKGVQYKQGDIWLLYQKYAEKGYTGTKTHNYLDEDGVTHPKTHTYWTQKGRLFVYELLKCDGIVPMIEKNSVLKIGG